MPAPIETNFSQAVVRLGQACVRIADLIVTYQTRLNSTFDDEVEEGLAALPVRVRQSVPLIGQSGKEVKVDYLIDAPRIPAAILGISARSRANATRGVNATFRKWYELFPRREEYQFVTLLDSNHNLWTDRDREYLEEVSEVFEFPAEADALRELVTID